MQDKPAQGCFFEHRKNHAGKNLTDTEHTVLEYILDHLDTVQTEGVRGVARANYTSTSTIMRLARKMNYSGFVDMCYKLRSLVETPRQTMQEEEDFLNGFSTQSLLNYNTYTQLKVCAEKLLEQRDKMIFVYGTGFSGTVATYLTQKLVNMGILCFSATAAIPWAFLRIRWSGWGCFSASPNPARPRWCAIRSRPRRKTACALWQLPASRRTAWPVRRPMVPGGEPVEAGRPEHHAQHLFSAGDDAHRADRLRIPPPVHGKRHQVRMSVHFAQKNHGFLNKSNRNALLFWVTRFHLFKKCLHLRWFVR